MTVTNWLGVIVMVVVALAVIAAFIVLHHLERNEGDLIDCEACGLEVPVDEADESGHFEDDRWYCEECGWAPEPFRILPATRRAP